jgi:hypothetical protein
MQFRICQDGKWGTGDTPDAVFAQVPFIDMESTIPQLVKLIRVKHGELAEVTI